MSRRFPVLFRIVLLLLTPMRYKFAEYFVSLHPQNNKTQEIMPEICKFYGIIIYLYIDDHRSTSGRLPKQERGEAGSITPRSCKAVWHGQHKVTIVINHCDEELAHGCLRAKAKMAGAQAASPNSEGSESEPCWQGEKSPAHTGELVCGQGLGRAAGDIEQGR